jgi:hypothetical protein
MGKFHCNILNLTHFILFYAWICICNENLLNYDVRVGDVSTNLNMDEIIKLVLGYEK